MDVQYTNWRRHALPSMYPFKLSERYGRMKETRDNIKSIKDLLIENEALHAEIDNLKKDIAEWAEICRLQEEKIQTLKKSNSEMSGRLIGLKFRNNQLTQEVDDMKLTRKYLTGKDAGARFARELLGGN